MSGKTDSYVLELEHAPSPYENADHDPVALKALQAQGDGDEALKVLRDGFQSYTKEDEKRVLRKIDWRLVPLMLAINGIQFVDKNVGSPPISSTITSFHFLDQLID